MVSNNLLAGLVVIALVISVGGLILTTTSLHQASITGAATGYANVTVATTVAISLQVTDVNFGSMQVNENNDTSDSSPPPFEVRNDGNVNVNVSVYATDLWNATGYQNPTPNYLGKCRDKDTNACGAGSVTVYTQMANTTNTTWYPIRELRFPAAFDEAYFDINVTVPIEESPGPKSSTVTFTAIQS
jgi:hypothetical protein